MKIAVLAHLEHPIAAPFAGGLEKHTKILCDGLSDRGHEVILYGDPRSEILGEIADICERYECFNYSHLKHENLEFYKTYLSKHYTYMEFLQDIMNDPTIDLIHNNSLHYLPVSFHKMLKIPMVSVLHTPPIRELEIAYGKSNQEQHVISVSNYLKSSWKNFVRTNSVIHNGVSVPTKLPVRDAQGHSFWFGRITPEKGLHDAIQACVLSNTPLRIAGPISHHEYFESHIRPHLNNIITYVGHLNDEEINHELRQASMTLVTPKWEEPFGLVAIEALAQGCPVIGYKRGGLPEIVTKEVGILVNADDVEALSRSMSHCRNIDSYQCWLRAKNFFSINAMITKYEETYHEITKYKRKSGILHSPRGFRSSTAGTHPGAIPHPFGSDVFHINREHTKS